MYENLKYISQAELEKDYFKEIYKSNLWVDEKLSILMDSDKETYGHSLRVAYLTNELSIHLGFTNETRTLLVKAALLHDIGKMSLPEGLLQKEKLSEEDKQIVEEHVRIGHEEIKEFDSHIARVMVGHHEFQKSSYPRKNSRPGEDQETKRLQYILALCDSVDALLSPRIYKEAWTPEEALDTLKETYDEEELISLAIKLRQEISI